MNTFDFRTSGNVNHMFLCWINFSIFEQVALVVLRKIEFDPWICSFYINIDLCPICFFGVFVKQAYDHHLETKKHKLKTI